MMAVKMLLPNDFSDLEPFANKWVIDQEPVRYEVRLSSSMEELQAFYDAALPRAKDAMAYLDQFDLYDLPSKEQNLLWLMMSLIIITFPVEAFKQPKVPDTGSTYLSKTIEPAI